METKEAYNLWANQYDTNENKTRDLEALSLRETLSQMYFNHALELGCGTGKNTEWLVERVNTLTAVDFSTEMLAKAKDKISSPKVNFVQADLNGSWDFSGNEKYDLIIFSLVLEHIENLSSIFEKLENGIAENGYVYIGELHPFKQYNGTKARFETNEGLQIVPCFNHHISDFTNLALKFGYRIITLHEYFDGDTNLEIPRILTILLRKE